MTYIIWGTAVALYLLFRFWYDGFRKPLTVKEIEDYTAQLQTREDVDSDQVEIFTKFMKEDDGKEFIMVNLIQFQPSPMPHPDTGEPTEARAVVMEYFKPLMKMFLARAGHPVMTSRAVGGYVDAWNTPANPPWHSLGLVRYRSRRDAIETTFLNDSFEGIHKYKYAALKQTFAFPSQVLNSTFISPRGTVALVLALGASLLQLALI